MKQFFKDNTELKQKIYDDLTKNLGKYDGTPGDIMIEVIMIFLCSSAICMNEGDHKHMKNWLLHLLDDYYDQILNTKEGDDEKK